MSVTTTTHVRGHRALVTAAGGAGLLGAVTVAMALRLVSTTTSVDWERVRTGTPSLGTLTPLVEIPLVGIGCVVAAWWALSLALVTLALVGQAAGLRSAMLASCIRAVAPAAVRRLAVAGIGAGLVLTAGPALAAEPVPDLGWVSTATPAADAGSADAGAHEGLDTATPQPTPAPPVVPAPSPEPAPAPAPAPAPNDTLTASPTTPTLPDPPAPSASTTVTVADGDTLWSISESLLGPDATDAEIAAAWPALHAANAATIGADPDVILVGQELVTPPAQRGT